MIAVRANEMKSKEKVKKDRAEGGGTRASRSKSNGVTEPQVEKRSNDERT